MSKCLCKLDWIFLNQLDFQLYYARDQKSNTWSVLCCFAIVQSSEYIQPSNICHACRLIKYFIYILLGIENVSNGILFDLFKKFYFCVFSTQTSIKNLPSRYSSLILPAGSHSQLCVSIAIQLPDDGSLAYPSSHCWQFSPPEWSGHTYKWISNNWYVQYSIIVAYNA